MGHYFLNIQYLLCKTASEWLLGGGLKMKVKGTFSVQGYISIMQTNVVVGEGMDVGGGNENEG